MEELAQMKSDFELLDMKSMKADVPIIDLFDALKGDYGDHIAETADKLRAVREICYDEADIDTQNEPQYETVGKVINHRAEEVFSQKKLWNERYKQRINELELTDPKAFSTRHQRQMWNFTGENIWIPYDLINRIKVSRKAQFENNQMPQEITGRDTGFADATKIFKATYIPEESTSSSSATTTTTPVANATKKK
eukprot:CAMPEP_0115026722 /NCGR_PEP_ID=MMETSP0216-20121206/34951_1 /TAXON_ID=223996 /ORGANISM="Protocruzia adherens, Strain Boccale" /LENGTH=194 /DNA_ID=CAMNT_0002401923 /DNA_START=35 /DNA_END=619 /DNA_ORIENTATION=-